MEPQKFYLKLKLQIKINPESLSNFSCDMEYPSLLLSFITNNKIPTSGSQTTFTVPSPLQESQEHFQVWSEVC